MELGNFSFGNSRGPVPIERNTGYEEELQRLFLTYEDEESCAGGYGPDFNNDTFEVMSYYWGDCTCGFDELENFPGKHDADCYQTKHKKIKAKVKKLGLEWNSEIEQKMVKELCEEYGYTYPYGSAVHCECPYPQRCATWYMEQGFPDGHLETCMYRKPNFLYKPTGLTIEWYKYPLRDSYFNQETTLDEFKEIIDKCIESLNDV